ncbi:hypothetical protein Q674_13895 [Acinetobacter sp. COS3]|nr:hypothetical protein Q674_13895 [Acinetobacter sp. COS3]
MFVMLNIYFLNKIKNLSKPCKGIQIILLQKLSLLNKNCIRIIKKNSIKKTIMLINVISIDFLCDFFVKFAEMFCVYKN